MLPKKKLKVIPIYRFFLAMDGISKALFLLLFAGLLVASVAAVIAVDDPAQWSIEINEFPSSAEEEITLQEYSRNYRTMRTEIGAWKEDVTFVATPVVPAKWPVVMFLVLQILGWAFLLTAATYVESYFAIALYFLFMLLVFLASPFVTMAPDSHIIFNGIYVVVLLTPAFLLQQKMLRLPFALRTLLFLVLAGAPFLIQAQASGWEGLHNSTVGMFPLLAVLLIVYLFFIANDINNLVFYAATNWKKRKYRQKFPVIFSVLLVILALEVLMLQREMDWNLIPTPQEIPLRPIHLIAFVSLIMVGTKQNMYPVLKDYVNNRGMSVAFTALALICMSTIFFHAAVGEFLFVHMIERIAIIFFTIMGIVHAFYIFWNFGPLIQARVNFYYLSMMPKRLLFFFVVIVTFLISFAFEASDHQKSRKLFTAIMYNRKADHALLQGDADLAWAGYFTSAAVAKGGPKGNYNLAMLALLQGKKDIAREHFKKATDFRPFPYAALNHATLELDAKQPDQAAYILSENFRREPNAFTANNLAQLFVAVDESDSAVVYMKRALRMQPERSSLYANMARIYMENGRPEWAEKFLAAGLKTEDIRATIVTNALFYNLRHGGNLHVSDSLLALPGVREQRSTAFNFAMDRFKRGDFEGAQTLLDTLLAVEETPDVLLLDGMLKFAKGRPQDAISRVLYMDGQFKDYRVYTDHFLGVAFFSAGLPEMAAQYFRKSADFGRTSDLMNQARMEIDRGNQEYAFEVLKEARVADSTLFEEVNKEITMMQLSQGEYFMASLGFDLGTLTPDEWARVGLYAGAIHNQPAALEAFRRLIALDSNTVTPYLEMGRISLSMSDSLALENLLPALEIEPTNVPIRIEVARAFARKGDKAKAGEMIAKLKKEAPENYELKLLEAEYLESIPDTTAALEILKTLYTAQPLDKRTVLRMSRIMRSQRNDFDGHALIYEALEINPVNPDFWYEMAHFERYLNREDACGAAAWKAIQLETDPERKRLVKEEFASEVTLHLENNPEINE